MSTKLDKSPLDSRSRTVQHHSSTPSLLAQTPRRPLANANSKRTKPSLSRQTPSSSHHVHMSNIFHDASSAIATAASPSPLASKSRRRHTKPFLSILPVRENLPSQISIVVRSELSEVDMAHAHSTGSRSRPVTAGHEGVEPISSGYSSPLPTTQDELQCINNQDTPQSIAAMRAKTSTFDESSTPSSITQWLDSISETDEDGTLEGDRSPLTMRARFFMSKPQRPLSADRQLFFENDSCTPTRRFRPLTPRYRPLTPRGCLTEPPRRRTPLSTPSKATESGKLYPDITIHEDDTAEPVAELSPSVEKYRKGSRPRRKRCFSYWDEDVLPELKPESDISVRRGDGRKNLGELPALTEAKGFIDGVETARFDFQVELPNSHHQIDNTI